MWKYVFIFFACLDIAFFQSTSEFVVTSTESPKENKQEKNVTILLDTVLYEMDILSYISNRFAKTLVTSKVKNPNTTPQETSFTVILPEKAFISEFVLVIGRKSYKAYIKEKEAAQQIYKLAKLRGQTAGHVATSAKSANEFTISVNVNAEAEAQFLLTFEELLERKNEQYELILDIHPGQLVEKLNLEVRISESRPLRFVRTPNLRTSNEISKAEKDFNSTDIEIIGKTAVVKFQPTLEEQKEIALQFNGKESVGVAGQFVVQYDVERDSRGGEVLLQDGYFVHFFAPDNLEPVPKHIVFVLDTSGSMGGQKIGKIKEAVKNILDQIQSDDYVSLVEFNSRVFVWNLHNTTKQLVMFDNYINPFEETNDELFLPEPLSASANGSIIKAKNAIDKLYAGGDTNIIGALETALVVIKTFADTKISSTQNLQPIIMFLTDGGSVGGPINKPDEILKIITKLNGKYAKAIIYSLSFGNEANKDFLRKLSLKNSGFSRHITVSAFTSFQLQNFYNEISVTLVSNITFEYTDAANVTRTQFPVFLKGTEIAICGVYDVNNANPLGNTKIHARRGTGAVSFVPTIEKPVSSLERLWAYLTVKEILEKRKTASQIEQIKLKNQAIELALKYSFVTEVTSLVVVRSDRELRPYFQAARTNTPNVNRRVAAYSRPSATSANRGVAAYSRPSATSANRGVAAYSRPSATSANRRVPGYSRPSASSAFRPSAPTHTSVDHGSVPHRTSTGGLRPFSKPQAYSPPRQVTAQHRGVPHRTGGFSLSKPQPVSALRPGKKGKKQQRGPTKHDPATTYKPNFSTTPVPNVEDASNWFPSVLNQNGTLAAGETPVSGGQMERNLYGGPVKHDVTTYRPNFSTTFSLNLEDALTWLRSVLNPNGTLTIGAGIYKLGYNVDLSLPEDKCTTTPINSTVKGICTLLKDCPQVYPYLTDFQTYQQYFCPVEKEYAGVCCPVK